MALDDSISTDFMTLIGGLHVSVGSIKAVNSENISVLRSALQLEAKTHGAYFDRKAFGRVVNSINKGEIEVWYMRASFDNRDLKNSNNTKIIGLTLGYPIVRIGDDLKAYDADYLPH